MTAARTVPTPPTPLIGRSGEVTAVRELLVAPGARLVTVTGPPGVGKTRLAAEVAAAVGPGFDGGAVWVDLARVRDRDLLVPEIAAAVEGEHAPGRELAPIRRELLVVLDNCEHLLDAMPRIGEMLAESPQLRVLATSRERLRLAAEQEFVLPPLPMPPEHDVGDLARLAANPAIALLLARSPAGVALTPQTARSLFDVCVQLDGLPLALELAAARLRVFTPGELAFRLGRRLEVLTSAARDSPPRHQNLRSALTWSHDLLPDAERVVFRRLSVLVGDWTLDAAAGVSGSDATSSIESLVDKSLVRRVASDASHARFRMLASVREFAAEQLDVYGEQADIERRHASYFAAAAREWESTVGTDAERDGWHDLGQAQADLRVAFGHRDELDGVDRLSLAAGLCWYAYTRGMLGSAGPVVAAVHADAGQPDAAIDERHLEPATAALIAAGIVEWSTGDNAAAERDLLRAIALSLRNGDERHTAIANAFLGHVSRAQHRFDDAVQRYDVARELFDRTGHTRGTAWATHDLGVLALVRGQIDEAQALLRTALLLFRAVGYDWAVAVTAGALADALCATGAMDEPAALYDEALQLHESVGDQRGVAQCLEGLADVSLSRGAAATAARLRGAALTLRRGVGALPGEWEQQRLDRMDATMAEALGRVDAEHAQHAGRTMPSRSAILLAAEAASAVAATASTPDVGLTGRQVEVAALVAAGATNRQIARTLGISEKTAEVHVRNIMERLQTPSRAGIAAWAVAHGVRPPTRDS